MRPPNPNLRDDPSVIDVEFRVVCFSAVKGVRSWLADVLEMTRVFGGSAEDAAASVTGYFAHVEGVQFARAIGQIASFVRENNDRVTTSNWFVDGGTDAERILVRFHLDAEQKTLCVLASCVILEEDGWAIENLAARRIA